MVKPEEIYNLFEKARWLTALGSGSSTDQTISLTSLNEWQIFCAQLSDQEFGLQISHTELSVPEFEWLSEDYGTKENSTPRPEVVELYRLALKGLSKASKSPWVQVGASDFQESIKLMVRHAIRMALSPTATPEPKFWLGVLQHYSNGHWPIGITSNGTIVLI